MTNEPVYFTELSFLTIAFFQESRRHEFGSVRERRSRDGRHGGSRDNHDGASGRSSYSRARHMNNTGSLKLKKDLLSKSVDYSDMDTVREGEKSGMVTRKQRSKSIDHLNQPQVPSLFLICSIAFFAHTAVTAACEVLRGGEGKR